MTSAAKAVTFAEQRAFAAKVAKEKAAIERAIEQVVQRVAQHCCMCNLCLAFFSLRVIAIKGPHTQHFRSNLQAPFRWLATSPQFAICDGTLNLSNYLVVFGQIPVGLAHVLRVASSGTCFAFAFSKEH